MREDWVRSRPVIDLDPLEVEALIAPLFPGCRVIEMTRIEGGLTNSNFRLRLANRRTALLLRFYQRSGDLAHKEMRLCRMIERQVHVPNYLHYAPENPVTGHAFALIDWIEGNSLQDLRPSLDAKAFLELGLAIGQMLAAVHAFAYRHFGFLDAELNPMGTMDLGGDALVSYLHKCFVEGLGGARLGEALTKDLLALAKREGHAVEMWQAKACLVHGDMNLSNIIVRQDASGTWDVAGLIDWEYAFAGAPAFDFGNLLRPPLDHAETFASALEKGYRAGGGDMPADWQRIARITDLFAYADVLHRPETSADVIEDAKADIARIIGASGT